ncbi:MAG: 2-C-methyl-D-erythritol 4-phosphate cytidylyltransferase [Crocinitomicaceae bacterium]
MIIKRSVIIAAGGSGSRMGSNIPKQFIELQGKTILQRTLERFRDTYPDIEIVIALPSEQLGQIDISNILVVAGGKNRFESVKNALAVSSGDLIAVHDAVRPFVSKEVIQKSFEAAELVGAAIPVLELKDSIRQLTSDESIPVDRDQYRLVQTPQVFKSNVIRLAYEQEYQSFFTDDASVVQACGQDIALVNGNEENIKITSPFDLKLAEFILSR